MLVNLEEQVGQVLLARGWRVATAESCTGGMIAHRLTNIAGSSAYVLGGIVAYANEVKILLLDVRPDTLMAHGAVSAPVAEEMVLGVLARLDADVAVSVTGIAGPGGGTAEKPVGLTYLAVATRAGVFRSERYVWRGDRLAVKQQSSDAALRLLLAAAQT
jgi:PncC family amidohydrolase